MPINSIEGLDASTYPEQSLETPAHLNFLKQPVPRLNSPLHKLHVAVKCSSQRINVCRLWIRKKTLKSRDFPDFTWCWSAIELQKYNTRSRSDTSDTSYLQKCSRNIVCYFWSPCRTSYSSKKSLFFHLYIPPSHSLSVQIPHSTQAIVKYSSLLGGDISKIRIYSQISKYRKPLGFVKPQYRNLK